MLYVQGASCRFSMLHVRATCTCCMFVPHVHAALPCCMPEPKEMIPLHLEQIR
jgi:hypothetical protein